MAAQILTELHGTGTAHFLPGPHKDNRLSLAMVQASEPQQFNDSRDAAPAQQQPTCNTSFEELNSDQQINCGRKLLARAMLGEPLYEEETGEVAKMQVQTPSNSLQRRSSQESSDSTASSSSGAFVTAALGDGRSNAGTAQHAVHAEPHGTEPTQATRSSAYTAGTSNAAHPPSVAQHTQQADGNSPSTSNSNHAGHAGSPSEPAATSNPATRARNMADGCRQAAPGVEASSIADGSQEQHREGGGRPWLKRAFSMVERENLNVDYESMNSLDKVRHPFCR